jgi:hypothetical protein
LHAFAKHAYTPPAPHVVATGAEQLPLLQLDAGLYVPVVGQLAPGHDDDAQHTPFTTNELAHSLPDPAGIPFAFFALQVPPLQYFPPLQSLSTRHEVLHAPLPHVRLFGQAAAAGVEHAPEPLQVAAGTTDKLSPEQTAAAH